MWTSGISRVLLKAQSLSAPRTCSVSLPSAIYKSTIHHSRCFVMRINNRLWSSPASAEEDASSVMILLAVCFKEAASFSS